VLEIGTAKRGYIFVFSSVIILNWNGLEDVRYNGAVYLKFYWEEA